MPWKADQVYEIIPKQSINRLMKTTAQRRGSIGQGIEERIATIPRNEFKSRLGEEGKRPIKGQNHTQDRET